MILTIYWRADPQVVDLVPNGAPERQRVIAAFLYKRFIDTLGTKIAIWSSARHHSDTILTIYGRADLRMVDLVPDGAPKRQRAITALQ